MALSSRGLLRVGTLRCWLWTVHQQRRMGREMRIPWSESLLYEKYLFCNDHIFAPPVLGCRDCLRNAGQRKFVLLDLSIESNIRKLDLPFPERWHGLAIHISLHVA